MFRSRKQSDFNAEIQSHLQIETDRLIADGLSPADAEAAARRTFGNVLRAEERFFESNRLLWLGQLHQDLRYAIRTLAKSPLFTAVAILSLALGIGANTAVFSVVDAFLLKNLPVRNPEQLRILTWVHTENEPVRDHSGYGMIDSATGKKISGSFSYRMYQLVRAMPELTDVVAYAPGGFTVMAQGASEFGRGQFVSGDYFSALGVQPLIGRALQIADDQPGSPGVVVLTHRYWEKRFGLDPEVIGKRIVIDNLPVTIAGVLPPGFQGLYPGAATDLFIPLSAIPRLTVTRYSLTRPDSWWVQIFGRLSPGVSRAQAESAVQAKVAAAIEEYAGSSKQKSMVPEVLLLPGARGVGLFRSIFGNTLYVLAAVVGLVLLIACTNMANLLLARSETRRREMAVRLSVGASRGRLIRQLLTESLLLAGAGGVLGLIVARPLLDLLVRFVAGGEPLTYHARLDLRTLGFTLAASILTGVFFGVFPAWRATRIDLTPALKDSRTGAVGEASRLRLGRLLVSAQVALSLLLLIGAGLFVRTLINLASVDLGFTSAGVLTFGTDGRGRGYTGQKLAGVYARLREKIEAIPGVQSAAMSQHGLIQGSMSGDDVWVPGITPKGRQPALLLSCSDNFLSTMRIPLLLGRGLTASDGPLAPRVAVVNESFVREYLAGRNPVGQIFSRGNQRTSPEAGPYQIIGIARDAHYQSVRDKVSPVVYFPYLQSVDRLGSVTFAIRTNVPPLSIANAVRRAVSDIDPAIPIADLRTQDEQIERSLSSERLFAFLVSSFGMLAALLAAIGLYGVMACTVSRRTAEIGIRMALGADRAHIRRLVLRDSLLMMGAGILIGLPAGLALTGLLQKLLYGVTQNDAISFAAAIVLMTGIGAVAAWMPARRAARVDPILALRCD
jgi:predicted permease